MSGTATTLTPLLRTARDRQGGDVGIVLVALAAAGQRIAAQLRRAVFEDRLGHTGTANVQGEQQAKLDVWANGVVIDALTKSGLVCTMVSEEMDEPLHLADRCEAARYVVCFDPVDGSSNLDVNGAVGTIFSIRPRSGRGPGHDADDAMQPGTAQLAAGYIMYGPSTVFVYTVGAGVDGFTLDPEVDDFVLSHRAIRIPARGSIYGINEGNAFIWEAGITSFLDYLRQTDKATGRPYTARYAGAMVADVHRTLLRGGIFLYPAIGRAGTKKSGKLRLQYEAAPMAFLVEQAGGRASTGHEPIREIQPTTPHQRVPIMIGSPDDVALAERFLAEARDTAG
jgi:fructose-1,6-bisphosphatase I